MIDLKQKSENDRCFLSKDCDPWLWNKRIAHINMDHLNRLISKDLVIGLPKLKFEKDKLCDACQKKVNKQKYLLNLKILFLPLNHCNYYTWICLDHQGS